MISNLFKAMPSRASAFASMNRPVQARFMATVRQRAAMEPATFTIRDGPMFSGKSFGARSNISGEAVFTTSLVGYPESLTDPSYRGQILVFTQPLIGNYGVPSAEKDPNGLLKYFESPQPPGSWSCCCRCRRAIQSLDCCPESGRVVCP